MIYKYFILRRQPKRFLNKISLIKRSELQFYKQLII